MGLFGLGLGETREVVDHEGGLGVDQKRGDLEVLQIPKQTLQHILILHVCYKILVIHYPEHIPK